MMRHVAVKYFKKRFGHLPDVVALAPGRVELMGNHTDYNGGEVVGMAINRYITVAVRRRKDRKIIIYDGLRSTRKPLTDSLDALLPKFDDESWANYPLSAIRIMLLNKFPITAGFEMTICSSLPAGAGLGSSAALILATLWAISKLFGIRMNRAFGVKLCQEVQKDFSESNLGLQDALICSLSREKLFLRVNCDDFTVRPLPAPAGGQIWIFNSQRPHVLANNFFATRVAECRRILHDIQETNPEVSSLVSLSAGRMRDTTRNFSITDRNRVLHVVHENKRVKYYSQALSQNNLGDLGNLMKASHQSSCELFENSSVELDFLVDELMLNENIYGARLTGGGFGGAVVALANHNFDLSQAQAIGKKYKQRFNTPADVFKVKAVDGVKAHFVSALKTGEVNTALRNQRKSNFWP